MSDGDEALTDPTGTRSASMVRSEEQLTVSRTVRVKGAVRLHKRIVTETVTHTVEIRREELVITEVAPEEISLQATVARDSTEQLVEREFELILHEEQTVITATIVPVERVRVRVQVVTDQVQIEETLRREHVDMVHDASDTTTTAAGFPGGAGVDTS